MGGMWKLEGVELGDSTTEIFVVASVRNADVRTVTEPIHGGTEYYERLGKNLTRMNLTFTILGQDTDKHDWVAYIMGILENRSEIQIESPSDEEDYRIIDDSRSIVFTPESKITVTQQNRAQYDLAFTAIVHGTLARDGGSYVITEAWREDFL